MNKPLLAVLLTMLCCAIAGYVIVSRQERRHAREMAMTGIAPPGHPDLEAPLEEWEQDALSRIEGGQP